MIESMILGPIQTNVYFIINDETKECIIVDPAYGEERIEKKLADEGLIPVAILLTHGHFDHIQAVEGLKKHTGVSVYASSDEKDVLKDPALNCSLEACGYGISIAADRWLSDGETFEEGGYSIETIHTPGHTEGSCCYLISEINALFSGDTLFEGSVGRTDLPTGSGSEIDRSLNEKLMKLPDETRVYPGHGGATTIEDERRWNPWVRGI